MSMTCQCCLQTNSEPTCTLCGWKQDHLNERGYSRLNGQTVGRARRAFMLRLPDLLDRAIRACG